MQIIIRRRGFLRRSKDSIIRSSNVEDEYQQGKERKKGKMKKIDKKKEKRKEKEKKKKKKKKNLELRYKWVRRGMVL